MRFTELAEANECLNPDWVEACRTLEGPADSVPKGGLTRRQRDALQFIARFIDVNGYSPNFREIAFGLGLKSNASIYRLTTALEERGFIARRYARRRSITLLRRP